MKLSEIRDRTDLELVRLAEHLKEDVFKFRLQKVTNQLENTNQIRAARRDLARVHSVIRARELGVEARKTDAALAPEQDKE